MPSKVSIATVIIKDLISNENFLIAGIDVHKLQLLFLDLIPENKKEYLMKCQFDSFTVMGFQIFI